MNWQQRQKWYWQLLQSEQICNPFVEDTPWQRHWQPIGQTGSRKSCLCWSRVLFFERDLYNILTLILLMLRPIDVLKEIQILWESSSAFRVISSSQDQSLQMDCLCEGCSPIKIIPPRLQYTTIGHNTWDASVATISTSFWQFLVFWVLSIR